MQATSDVIDKNWKALIKPNKLEITSNEDKTIAKVVAEDPSIKSEVIESAKKGISPEEFAKQFAEAERLGITDSTAKVSEAAKASGFSKDVMPSLETMKSDFFDADAHNAAMAEMAEDIQAGGIGEGVGAAEAAASYTEADRDSQRAQSEAEQALADAKAQALEEGRAQAAREAQVTVEALEEQLAEAKPEAQRQKEVYQKACNVFHFQNLPY